jgi:hypothetical protein
VLKRCVFAGSVAALCASVAVGAQSTSSGQEGQTGAGTTAQSDTRSSSAGSTTTVIGCVYREQDIPGRSPNVAERVGVLEDYILAEVGGAGASTATPGETAGTSGTTGTSGTLSSGGKMYKLEHVKDERLSSFVGKRVEVTGRIDAEAGDQTRATGTSGTTATPDQSAGPDKVNLPEFEISSIRETSGSCPAQPSSAR